MTDLGSSDRLAAALAHLGSTIDARAKEGDASKSWTAKLLAKGPESCAEKVHEEGMELAEAVGTSLARPFCMVNSREQRGDDVPTGSVNHAHLI